MTPQIPKSFVDHLAWIVPSIIMIALWILDHWTVTGSGVSAIWERIWVPLAVYGAFRLVRFVRTRYQHFNRLEERLASFETDTRNKLQAVEKSLVASDTASKTVAVELETLRDALREEFNHRQKLEGQVAELKERLSTLTKREPSPAELLATSVGTSSKGTGVLQRSSKTLADMTPATLLIDQSALSSGLFGLGKINQPDTRPSKRNIRSLEDDPG